MKKSVAPEEVPEDMESINPSDTRTSVVGDTEQEADVDDEIKEANLRLERFEKEAAEIKQRKIQEHIEYINYNKFPTILVQKLTS